MGTSCVPYLWSKAPLCKPQRQVWFSDIILNKSMANLTERKKGIFTPCIHLDAAKFYISVVAAAQMC